MPKHQSPHWSKNPVAVDAKSKLEGAVKKLFKAESEKIAEQIADAYGKKERKA
jgi:hypothetical protein